MNSKRFYITTPIYYASGRPHLGHAYCTVLCDVLKRFKRLFGHEVFFSTGMDEHGQKIEKNAKESGISPQDFVDNISINFKQLWQKLNINYDVFIRTTEQYHIDNAQKTFSKMLKKGDIFLENIPGGMVLIVKLFGQKDRLEKKKNV